MLTCSHLLIKKKNIWLLVTEFSGSSKKLLHNSGYSNHFCFAADFGENEFFSLFCVVFVCFIWQIAFCIYKSSSSGMLVGDY